MRITSRERERQLRERVAPSYERHLVQLESEVDIFNRIEAERDPNYDVAATLQQIDEEQAEQSAKWNRARERRAAEAKC